MMPRSYHSAWVPIWFVGRYCASPRTGICTELCCFRIDPEAKDKVSAACMHARSWEAIHRPLQKPQDTGNTKRGLKPCAREGYPGHLPGACIELEQVAATLVFQILQTTTRYLASLQNNCLQRNLAPGSILDPFQQGRTALVDLEDGLLLPIDRPSPSTLTLLDSSAASNTTDHQILPAGPQEAAGVTRNMPKWLRPLLANQMENCSCTSKPQ